MKATVFAVALAMGAVGCGPGYQLTMTSPDSVVAKPANCQFVVITTRPDRPFDEIATLDHTRGYPSRDVGDFKSRVAENVCKAGGDAVIAKYGESDNHAGYVQGTVIRWK